MRWVTVGIVLLSMCVGTRAQPLRRVRVDTPQAAAAARQLIAAGFDVLETTMTVGSFEIIGSAEEMEEFVQICGPHTDYLWDLMIAKPEN